MSLSFEHILHASELLKVGKTNILCKSSASFNRNTRFNGTFTIHFIYLVI